MAILADVYVLCPCCNNAKLGVTINPGEPMVRYYADGSGHPGSPPSIDAIVDGACECDTSDLVDHEKFMQALWERVQAELPVEPDYDED